MNFFFIFLFIGVIIFLMSSIKISQEQERFAVFVIGQYRGLKGPGVLLKYFGREVEWIRIRLGDKGELLNEDLARFHDKDIPIISFSKIPIGSRVQITGFEDDKVRIEKSAEQTRIIRCEKCGHEMRI